MNTSRTILRWSLLRTITPQWLSRFSRDDTGAVYSLSMALTLPFYVLLVGFLVEVSLLLNVQVGVDYAAWAAARSAIVWIPAEETSLSTREQNADMIRRAAVNAISAWSSSNAKPPTPSSDTQGADAVLQGYQSAAIGDQQKPVYVTKKWLYADAATRVDFDPPLDELWNAKSDDVSEERTVRVTVHYQMPFNLPGIGMILGRHNGSGWVRDLQSTVELKLERPRTINGRLGIEYDSRPVR